jgi:hypothetical protein
MSNGVSSNFSFCISAIGGFEGVATSSTMIKFSHASTKTKRVAETIWYLYLKGVDAYI